MKISSILISFFFHFPNIVLEYFQAFNFRIANAFRSLLFKTWPFKLCGILGVHEAQEKNYPGFPNALEGLIAILVLSEFIFLCSTGVTTVLTMTTLMMGARTSLPNANCFIKAIDVYLGICFSFIFGALLEYAVAHFCTLHRPSSKELPKVF